MTTMDIERFFADSKNRNKTLHITSENGIEKVYVFDQTHGISEEMKMVDRSWLVYLIILIIGALFVAALTDNLPFLR